MTPTDLARLSTLNLSMRQFAAVTGTHPETVRGWGRVRHERGVQDTPAWVGLLFDAWGYRPELLDAALERSKCQHCADLSVDTTAERAHNQPTPATPAGTE